jgi:hypothetical protein
LAASFIFSRNRNSREITPHVWVHPDDDDRR